LGEVCPPKKMEEIGMSRLKQMESSHYDQTYMGYSQQGLTPE